MTYKFQNLCASALLVSLFPAAYAANSKQVAQRKRVLSDQTEETDSSKHLIDRSETAASRPGSNSIFASAPSAFPNMLDQLASTGVMYGPIGAPMNRANQPAFGVSMASVTLEGIEKADGIKVKQSADANLTNFFAVYPLPIGIRLGAAYHQTSMKVKYSESSSDSFKFSVKGEDDHMSLSGAFVLPNGLGAALTLSNNSESRSATDYSKEEETQYGHLNPQLMLVKDFGELVLSWDHTMRHEVSDKTGFYRLDFEGNADTFHPIASVTRNKNSETSDDEHDAFELTGGGRLMLDSFSNIRFLVNMHEAFYDGREYASTNSVAGFGLNVLGEQLFDNNHILSYALGYGMNSGKGMLGSKSSTITTSALSVGVGYRYKM